MEKEKHTRREIVDAKERFEEEFKTLECLRAPESGKTRGVDSFAIALIKVERQARRLFTFLIFQYPCFDKNDAAKLRNTLIKQDNGKNLVIYFSAILEGINKVAPKTVSELIGANYDVLFDQLKSAQKIRNKIFHGQVTNQSLSRNKLFGYIDSLLEWCRLLGAASLKTFGYDGFLDNSYDKQRAAAGLAAQLKYPINSIDDYKKLLKDLQSIRELK
jgi:hypothetical protein